MCTCNNPGSSTARWETGESAEACGSVSSVHTVVNERPCLKQHGRWGWTPEVILWPGTCHDMGACVCASHITHSSTHKISYTYTHPTPHMHSQKNLHTLVYMCTRAHVHTCTYTSHITLALTHTCTHISHHTCTHKHTYLHTHAHTYIHPTSHIYPHTHMHTHLQHTWTHMHTHTHTRTLALAHAPLNNLNAIFRVSFFYSLYKLSS